MTLRQLDPAYAELVVSDNGPGIPPHERSLVFERFFRSASARAMPGSGLGLAIVKQVVLKHGGALRVEDTVPGGQPRARRSMCCFPGVRYRLRPTPRPQPTPVAPQTRETLWVPRTLSQRILSPPRQGSCGYC